MCGIAGLFSLSGITNDSETAITNMLGEIVHRGPDEAGYYVDNYMAMGTVRLSIVDIHNGSQPMCDDSQRYWICFNGEIYNHKELRKQLEYMGWVFRTRSDTEVALYSYLQWKDQALEKFNGAFAFCIYDSLNTSIFAARDRYGKKPLFYANVGDVFLFASEIKAFRPIPEFTFEFDVKELISISTIWTPLPNSSCFQNVSQLPHGNYLELDDKGLRIRSWQKEYMPAISLPKVAHEEAIADIRASLESGVQYRLESDVEVGVYLSGGLDSSIIAMLASRHYKNKLRTFSVKFEDERYDESLAQKEVFDYLNIENSNVSITHKHIAEKFYDAVYHSEVPVFRTAFVPMLLLSELASNEGVKVVLTGEGADEAFLGYDIFRETMLRNEWSSLSVAERKSRLLSLNHFLGHFSEDNINMLYRIYENYSKDTNNPLFSHEMRFKNGQFTSRLFSQKQPFCAKILKYLDGDDDFSSLSKIERAQWIEYQTLLPGYLLSTQGDRMCAANGVENRCPFLDHRVVETAKRYNLQYDNGQVEKQLLKEAFKKDLPDSVTKKKKFPYRAPDSISLLNSKVDCLELSLSENEISKLPFLDKRMCGAFTNKMRQSKKSEISPREDQAFVFLQSVMSLNEQYVANRYKVDKVKQKSIEKIITKRIVHRVNSTREESVF